jgi:hypothetical protein
MTKFDRGRASPEVARAAAMRRAAVISFYRKYEAQHKQAPRCRIIADTLGFTDAQVYSVFTWMRLHKMIKAVAK